MGEHDFNPAALAKKNGQQVRVADLGEGIGLAGLEWELVKKADGTTVCVLMAIGGPVSDIVGITLRKAPLAEFPVPALEQIRVMLGGKEPEPKQEVVA